MKIIQILVIIVVLVLVFLAFRPMAQVKKVSDTNDDLDLQTGWPVTWNFDWGGGPGYDRHEILTSRGPYNPGGHY
jgi:hypothetical protein